MRAQVLNVFAGALGLAAVVASAPAPSGTTDDCAVPSTATVFVTVPASSLEPSTVYLTVPASSIEINLSEAPTTTLTRFATLTSTTLTPQSLTEHISAVSTSSASGQVIPGSPYDSTITELATITVTNVHLTPLGGSYVTYTETPAPNGLLNYVVENGTTYWLDGQTPAPSESYVYSTSSITVEPIYAGPPSSESESSTVTLQSTIFVTQQFTLTETLQSTSSSSGQGVLSSASFGTGLPYAKSAGGWNATKTSSVGGILSGVTTGISSSTNAGVLANASPTLVLYSSLNIYQTSHSTISKSSLAAQSGFYALGSPVSGYANPTTPSDPGAATSSAMGQLTTAVINNQTVTWGASSGLGVKTSNSLCTETPGIPASTSAPYISSTFATSVRVTSAASGIFTSTSSSFGSTFGSSSAFINNTTTTSSDLLSSILAGLTSSAGDTSSSVSSALGALTSVSTTESSSFISGASYSYSSPIASSTDSSSALGALTSVSATPSGVVSSLSSASDDCATSTGSGVLSFTASSSALGALTSTSGKFSSISSVGTYSYSSPASSPTASTSALGGLTSLSSSVSTTLSSSTSSPANSSSSAVASSKLSSTYAVPTSAPVYSSSFAPSYTSSSKTSTSVLSSVSASASSTCGEQGDFTLNFDDIPPLSIGNQSESSVQPEPVFNPYHQFDFSDGFTVVPPPTVPYDPSSPPLFLEFIPNFNVNGTNTQAGPNTAEEGYNGQISDGDGDQTGCFRFNMYGASMGCDSTGAPCDFTFTGYQLDASRNEVLIATQTKAVPACADITAGNCQLTLVDLDYQFTNLAFVRVNVTVGNEPKIWWMDDLRLGWYDNSCAMGLCRQQTHLP